MKKNHIKILKPVQSTGSVSNSTTKTRDTGMGCIPTGQPPDSVI